ncbi:hypothetical protein LPJ64_004475 [Coemansia asiatica]|uniref:RING-type domain-containing protein n=1 Tax=Coemansia asiatica TaxID=1052880 RepID=A0A9W8CJ04_9FUNG|nr:hypothetical protein LPJ64_004475 [Coemansia asiatica]
MISPDTLIIIKATLGAVSVCIFFLSAALFLYYFRIYFTPWPRIERWRGRHPLWISMIRDEEQQKPLPKKMTLDEIESKLPASLRLQGFCPVCLSNIKDEQMARVLDCEHCFHLACIDPWLTTNASCPTCRKEIIVQNKV